MPKLKLSEVIEEINPFEKGECVYLRMRGLKKGFGILSGAHSRALFLVLPEEYSKVIRGGCVSAYVLCKNHKTKYLNEIVEGDELLTANEEGEISSSIVETSKIRVAQMKLIRGKYKISGKEVFELLRNNGEDYFNAYREILHLKETKTGKEIHVLDINKYKNNGNQKISSMPKTRSVFQHRKEEVCAYLDVSTALPSNNAVTDKAYIQMPTLQSRHFGMSYEGYCLER